MGHSATKCYVVSNYEEAEQAFNEIKPVTRSSKTVWNNTNVRPLYKGTGRTSYHCYRLQRNVKDGNPFYDVYLYDTIIARFHEPTTNKQGQVERITYYNYYNSITTRDFMQHVVRRSWRMIERTTTGREVMVPTGISSSKHRTIDLMDNAPFSLRRVLVDDKLDTERSHHTRFFVKASTEEDKAKRAEIRKRIELVVNLAVMRMPMMEADVRLTYRAGRPFAGVLNTYKWTYCRGLADPDVILDDAMTEQALAAFFNLSQEVYNSLASKRAYNEGISYQTFDHLKPHELKNPVTEDDLRKALVRFVLDQSGAMKLSGKKYLPMWAAPSEWPATGVFSE